jgi:NAD(P)-dependent dehydrogenase (short-subunit alcohol dehydrogenase family)
MTNQYNSPTITLVTGAAGAIGSSMTDRFQKEGGIVIAVDLSSPNEAGTGGTVDWRPTDVGDEAAVTDLFTAAIAEHGRIDNLINCAGITRDSTLHKMTFDQWREVLRVNLDAAFLTTREMVRHIRNRGKGGAVVNIASISGTLGNLGQGNYAASKAGLVSLTKVTAREIARYGARANAIAPGFIRSPMTDAIPDGIREERAAAAPLGRAGQPEEIASIAAWLCSEDSSFVTGTLIDASGGRGM